LPPSAQHATETSILLGIEQQQAETQVYLLADVIYYTPQQLLRPSLIDSPSLLLLLPFVCLSASCTWRPEILLWSERESGRNESIKIK
jgi:hypothetical protein